MPCSFQSFSSRTSSFVSYTPTIPASVKRSCLELKNLSNSFTTEQNICERVQRAAQILKKNPLLGVPLSPEDCVRLEEVLQKRKISPLLIALGCSLFFLLVPAILAYFAHEYNKRVDGATQEVQDLSALLQNEEISAFRSLQNNLAALKKIEKRFALEKKELELIQKYPTLPLPPKRVLSLEKLYEGLKEKVAASIANYPHFDSVLKKEETEEIRSTSSRLQRLCNLEKRLENEEKRSREIAWNRLERAKQEQQISLTKELLAIELLTPIEGDCGIHNYGNSCYIASVLQSMRLSSIGRHLVFRKLPIKKRAEREEPALSAASFPKKEAVPHRSSAEETSSLFPYAFFTDFFTEGLEKSSTSLDPNKTPLSKEEFATSLQQRLRTIFQLLDAGKSVSRQAIKDLKTLLAQSSSPWPVDPTEAHRQHDAMEFELYLKTALLEDLIQLEDGKILAVDTLHEMVCKETELVLEPSCLTKPSLKKAYSIWSGQEEKKEPVLRLDLFEQFKTSYKKIHRRESSREAQLAFFDSFFLKQAISNQEEIDLYLVKPESPLSLFFSSAEGRALKERIKKSGSSASLKQKKEGELYLAGGGELYLAQGEERPPLLRKIGTVHQNLKRVNAPQNISVTLERNIFERSMGRAIKNNSCVPSAPSLAPPIFSQGLHNPPCRDSFYEISSCIFHTGTTPQSGHYVFYKKRGENWYLYNDHSVSLDKNFDPNQPIAAQYLYKLLYEKIPQEKRDSKTKESDLLPTLLDEK